MTIQSEIQRIKNNIADAYSTCERKGATLPSNQNSANLSATISSISGDGTVIPNIETLTITPTTSQQTITAPSGTDGYNPISVSAVTSAIDSNIIAENIKSGVEILGVTGTLIKLRGTTATITANGIYTPGGTYNGYTEVIVDVPSTQGINVETGITYSYSALVFSQRLCDELSINSHSAYLGTDILHYDDPLFIYVNNNNVCYSQQVDARQTLIGKINFSQDYTNGSQNNNYIVISDIEMYISGYASNFDNSLTGGQQGGGEQVQPSGVTVDTANNIITFSSAYMTDLTSGQINSDVVIAKQGTNYQITQGNCNFQSQIWNTNDGVNTGYFRFENNQISLTSSGNENGIFATVTYNFTQASQATNWQSDITITNVTITAPSNWAE